MALIVRAAYLKLNCPTAIASFADLTLSFLDLVKIANLQCFCISAVILDFRTDLVSGSEEVVSFLIVRSIVLV